MLIFIRASFLHDEEGELPAEPEDDVPDAVHHAAGHLRRLLQLLLGETCNIEHSQAGILLQYI